MTKHLLIVQEFAYRKAFGGFFSKGHHDLDQFATLVTRRRHGTSVDAQQCYHAYARNMGYRGQIELQLLPSQKVGTFPVTVWATDAVPASNNDSSNKGPDRI